MQGGMVRHGAFHGIGMGSRRPPVPCRGRRLVPHALSRPDTAAAAIAQGIELCREKKYDAAQGLFEAALELPGTGTKRFRNKPPQISNSERIAALYNIACCQGQLGNIQNGMIALAGALESGYAEFDQMRNDPDLAPLRESPKFEGLLQRFGGAQPKGFLERFKR
ncbi:hypothetical protein ACKKBG_A12160 [Auxenochlorella protothecoides x Auxenochlorella symbiontica]